MRFEPSRSHAERGNQKTRFEPSRSHALRGNEGYATLCVARPDAERREEAGSHAERGNQKFDLETCSSLAPCGCVAFSGDGHGGGGRVGARDPRSLRPAPVRVGLVPRPTYSLILQADFQRTAPCKSPVVARWTGSILKAVKRTVKRSGRVPATEVWHCFSEAVAHWGACPWPANNPGQSSHRSGQHVHAVRSGGSS